MIRLMIADDEYLIRRMIADSVEWTELGIEIVGEAEDGEEALALIDAVRPHLMIVDINMPFLDGLALSEIVRERDPDIKIIILTGYEEFDYARQAIASGVHSYLVKPINEDELREAAAGAKREIVQSFRRRSYVAELENDFRTNRNSLKEDFLNRLVAGTAVEKDGDLFDRLSRYGAALFPSCIQAAVLEIDYAEQLWPDLKDRELRSFAVSNICGDILSDYTKALCFVGPNHRAICLFNEFPEVIAAFGQIRAQLKEFYRLDVTIGLGSEYDGAEGIRLSFEEAKLALEAKFYNGCDRTYEYSPVFKSVPASYPYEAVDKDCLLVRLRIGETNEAEAYVSRIFDKLQALRAPVSLIKTAAIESASSVLAFAAETRPPEERNGAGDNAFLAFVSSRQSLHDMKQAIVDRLREEGNRVRKSAAGHPALVRSALTYIEENYSDEDLSLSDAAAQLFVNTSHLSTVFKKELNVSFSDYVVEHRLKKAKDLMDQGGEPQIGFVAHRVGYGDPLYFGKSFKKRYGVSPAAYYELKRSGGNRQK